MRGNRDGGCDGRDSRRMNDCCDGRNSGRMNDCGCEEEHNHDHDDCGCSANNRESCEVPGMIPPPWQEYPAFPRRDRNDGCNG